MTHHNSSPSLGRRAGCCLLILALTVGTVFSADSPDIRRDATVMAVQKAMPAVVNIATETLVEVNDPREDLFREFFNPYYRRRAPNTQHSLGSGVIIDTSDYHPAPNFCCLGHAACVHSRHEQSLHVRETETLRQFGRQFLQR